VWDCSGLQPLQFLVPCRLTKGRLCHLREQGREGQQRATVLTYLLYSIWASGADVASLVCLRDVEIGGLDFLPYHGRCCRLPSSRYATKTGSWGGGKCFRTISWGRRSMRCYTRYSSGTLVQRLLSLSTTQITLFTRGFAKCIGGQRRDLQRMHVRTRRLAHANASLSIMAQCIVHTAYPILTHSKFPVMKIEFVGTIRICGLVTPSALDDCHFRRWLAFFVLYSKSGRSDDGSRNPLLPPCCRLRQSSGIRTSQTFVRVMH
jgi:hypothetical protein